MWLMILVSGASAADCTAPEILFTVPADGNTKVSPGTWLAVGYLAGCGGTGFRVIGGRAVGPALDLTVDATTEGVWLLQDLGAFEASSIYQIDVEAFGGDSADRWFGITNLAAEAVTGTPEIHVDYARLLDDGSIFVAYSVTLVDDPEAETWFEVRRSLDGGAAELVQMGGSWFGTAFTDSSLTAETGEACWELVQRSIDGSTVGTAEPACLRPAEVTEDPDDDTGTAKSPKTSTGCATGGVSPTALGIGGAIAAAWRRRGG